MTLPNFTGIRQGLQTALADADTDISQILDRPPEQLPAVMTAWLGDFTSEVRMGASEMWTHAVPLTVAVNRRGYVEDESLTTENVIESVMQVIRANQSLGGACNSCAVIGCRTGAIPFGQESMFGFTLDLSIREKGATSLAV